MTSIFHLIWTTVLLGGIALIGTAFMPQWPWLIKDALLALGGFFVGSASMVMWMNYQIWGD